MREASIVWNKVREWPPVVTAGVALLALFAMLAILAGSALVSYGRGGYATT